MVRMLTRRALLHNGIGESKCGKECEEVYWLSGLNKLLRGLCLGFLLITSHAC